MAHLFSPAVREIVVPFWCNYNDPFQNRFYTWRKLWLNLAIAEKEFGLPISDDAIEQMQANLVCITSFIVIHFPLVYRMNRASRCRALRQSSSR